LQNVIGTPGCDSRDSPTVIIPKERDSRAVPLSHFRSAADTLVGLPKSVTLVAKKPSQKQKNMVISRKNV